MCVHPTLWIEHLPVFGEREGMERWLLPRRGDQGCRLTPAGWQGTSPLASPCLLSVA